MGVVFLQPGGNWGQGSSAPWEMCQERSPAAVRMETGRAGAHVEGVAVCVCVCRHRSLSPLASLPPAHTYHWLHSTGRQEVTTWIAVHQASLSVTNSQSLLKLVSIESVMPSNHLILCCPLLLLPSIFPSIRVFPDELALRLK